MTDLQTTPHAGFYLNGRRYAADAEGVIADVAADDIPALVAAGCVAPPHWRHPPPQALAAAAPRPPAAPTVRLKGRPHAAYQPATAVRYVADGEGFFQAAVEHLKALQRAGCNLAESVDH
jgi:hypothetical protein